MFSLFKKNKKVERVLSKINVPKNIGNSEYPSSNLTPQKLTKIFREADAGYASRQMELFEEMEEKDPHLFSQIQTRKNAVCGLDWEIIAYSDDEKDKEIAGFVKDVLKNIKNFDNAILDLLDAVGKGISFLEINWELVQGFLKVKNLEYIHPKYFFWENEDLKILTNEESKGISLKDVQKNKIIIHRYKARSGHESRAGLLRVVAWMYLFKNYTLKDWVTFLEKYGMPMLLGKYDEASSEDDKNTLVNALINIGTDSTGIISKSTEIEIVDNDKKSSSDVFENMARFCDEQMSKAILGQTLTSDSGGSYAQSKVHNEVRQDLTRADCKALSDTLKECLIKPIVSLNFGEKYGVPDFVFDFEEAGDLLKTVEMYSKLKNELGLDISNEHLYEKFRIPKPEIKSEQINQQLNLKDDLKKKSQNEIDDIVGTLKEYGTKNFKKSIEMFLNKIENLENLEQIKDIFENEKNLEDILNSMNSSFNKESLKAGLIIANLTGRYQDE